jgi:hypothetical protein
MFRALGKKSLLSKSPIIIEKGNVVINIDQEIWESVLYHHSYPLENSKEMKSYIASTKGLFIFSKESDYIMTNSKLRTVTLATECRIDITYMLQKEYKLNKKNEIEKREQEKIRMNKIEREKTERIMKVEDEI